MQKLTLSRHGSYAVLAIGSFLESGSDPEKVGHPGVDYYTL